MTRKLLLTGSAVLVVVGAIFLLQTVLPGPGADVGKNAVLTTAPSTRPPATVQTLRRSPGPTTAQTTVQAPAQTSGQTPEQTTETDRPVARSAPATAASPRPVAPVSAARPAPAAPRPVTLTRDATAKPVGPAQSVAPEPATSTGPAAPKPAVRARPVAPKPPPTPDFGIPVTIGDATQIVAVTAPSKSSTTGTLTAWQEQSNGTWIPEFPPVTAHLGRDGVGPPSEYDSNTPQGTWGMTQAFGREANPGTSLPYSQVSDRDWWVSDVKSPDYNTYQSCAASACPFDTGAGENLYNAGPVYDYAVVMDVNRWPAIPGDGSAYFLHVTDGGPTAGCVAIDAGSLVAIMQWLKPAAHPRIAVGIG